VDGRHLVVGALERIAVAVVCLAGLFGCGACGGQAATPGQPDRVVGPVASRGNTMLAVKVKPEELVEKPVSPLIYGNFIESGFARQVEGMWAEMLFNRSFEQVPPYTQGMWVSLGRRGPVKKAGDAWWHSGYEENAWYLVPGNADAAWTVTHCWWFHHGYQAGWLRNESKDAWAAFAQDGIYLRKGERYEFSGSLRVGPGCWERNVEAQIRFYREGDWTTPIASHTVRGIAHSYAVHTWSFDNKGFEGRATFSVWIAPGTGLAVDGFSLMPASNLDGWRKDVVEAARRVNPKIIRWPGGCFASFYRWRDGIGPRSDRIAKESIYWGGLYENDVGTPEFMQFCRLVDAEPFICVNMMTGTPEEAADWVAYCNAPASHPIGALRAKDGFDEPFGVTYWDLDNEPFRKYGAREYAERCVVFSRAMKAVDPDIQVVLVGYGEYNGPLGEMLEIAGRDVDLVADRAVEEQTLRRDLKIVRRYNEQHGTGIRMCNTEWPAPEGDIPPTLDEADLERFQTEKSRRPCWYSAMNVAKTLLTFQRLGGDFVFSNFNNFANTWGQNVIECPKEGVWLSAAGRVFEIFSRSPAAWPLAIEGSDALEHVVVQAAWDEKRESLCLVVINYRSEPVEVAFDLGDLGKPFSTSETTVLRAPSLVTINTLEKPDAIERTESGEALTGPDAHTLSAPPFSVVHVVLR